MLAPCMHVVGQLLALLISIQCMSLSRGAFCGAPGRRTLFEHLSLMRVGCQAVARLTQTLQSVTDARDELETSLANARVRDMAITR